LTAAVAAIEVDIFRFFLFLLSLINQVDISTLNIIEICIFDDLFIVLFFLK